jgi:hypothetical protein
MNILPAISTASTIAYVSYIIYRFHGIPASISESFYLLGEDEDARLMFDAWTIMAGAPIMYFMMDNSEGWTKGLAFLSGMGLMLIGYAPRFKWKLERPIHFIATGIAAIASMIWSYKTGGSLLKLLALILTALALGNNISGITTNGYRKSIMFFLEIAAFANLYTHVII